MADKKKITIHNSLSKGFRQIHADGVFGGLTPRGLINLNFFAERQPIPKSQDFGIEDTGSLSNTPISTSQDSKVGILREFDFGIYLDLFVAKQLRDFLTDNIERLEVLQLEKQAQKNKK